MTLFVQLIKPAFNEFKWTVGHEIVFNIALVVTIGVLNYTYSFFLFSFDDFTISRLATFVGYTISVGIFPVVVLVLLHQTQLNKLHNSNAKEINKNINSQSLELSDFKSATLKGEYNEELSLNIDDLIYIESEGNYILTNYETADGPRKIKLRSTLKDIMLQLTDHPQILKTHRAFAVNLKKVKSVNGNAQGLRLQIEGLDTEVPVSRSQVKSFKSAINQLK